ncbi:hypothetical protein [Mucilaginibacter sp. UYCu711]|uniref:hypothetical protein n=1 Tax=Mucilaginibacter sp. UYCu711 TaxID=3156339 RepID=UPI003D24CC2D
MKTLKLKPEHETSVIGQILSLKSQLDYHKNNIAPFFHEMEKWEQKEYSAVNADNEVELERLKQHIIANTPTFNQFLQQYQSGLCVPMFVNIYILN